MTYSKLGPAARLLAWVRLLVLSATWPERPFSASASVGVGGPAAPSLSPPSARSALMRPPGKEAAESHLRALVEVYQRGMREPLPLYVRTSAAWAGAMTEGSDPERAAAAAWLSGYDFEKEDKDAEHILVLGSVLPFKEMVQRAGRAARR